MKTDMEGIDWSGGDCPVDWDAVVRVEFRNGEIAQCEAGSLDWSHPTEHNADYSGFDIVRYVEVVE